MELSTRFDFATAEAEAYPRWETSGEFRADADSSRPPYCIVIPPPNITGVLHMGHALNNTLQDALIRFRHMDGMNTLWLPGTDHAAIATEVVVIRRLEAQGIQRPRETLGREKFLEKVWEWRETSGGTIISQLKRMGCACDWSRERFTMDEGLSVAVRKVFMRLYNEGLIYRGTYLVNWSPGAQTTLSDDEVDYVEKVGKLYHIKYPLADEPTRFITVATTRPETMLGDVAVAVHPEDPRYEGLVGKMLKLPLTDRQIPIIADTMVEREFGTGALKITPAHDPNDYLAGKRHNLPEIAVFDKQARINENGGQYRGLDRYDARKAIVKDLTEVGLLVKAEDHAQRVGTCYRTGVEIEPMLSMQWFVKVGPLAVKARAAVADGKVRFHPEARKNDYFRWLDNLRDWAISRQIWWGHQIPAFFDENDEVHVPTSEDEYQAMRKKCADPKSGWRQDSDTLDTWFSSALWPFSTLGWPDESSPDLKTFYPTSTLVTAKDIIFFWVARMIMMGIHFMGEVPFRDVYFNPIVADEHGKKMSKSAGNAIDPLLLIDEYGADALRGCLSAYSGREQHISFNVKDCEGFRNFLNKLWNASRLVLTNTEDLPAEAIARVGGSSWPLERLEDRWILSRFRQVAAEVTRHLEEFSFDEAVALIRDFFWSDFCDYYLELSKPRIYGGGQQPDPQDKSTVQALLVVVLEGSLRLLHPFCPFITEEIWRVLQARYTGTTPPSGKVAGPGAATLASIHCSSMFTAPWPRMTEAEATGDSEADAEFELLRDVLYTLRNIRGEMGMAPGVQPAVVFVSDDDAVRQSLDNERTFFTTLGRTGAITVTKDDVRPPFASTGVVRSVKVYVEMPAEQRAKEAARLDKEITKTESLVSAQAKKLESPNFVEKAPAAVVDKEREKLSTLQRELEELRQKRQEIGAV